MPNLVVSSGLVSFDGHSYRAAVGRSGIIPWANKREGDGATPAGSWPIRRIWYRADRIPALPTTLPTHTITPSDGWCDDRSDPAYNRPVTLPYPASCEEMYRSDNLYDIVIELGYNDDPVVPGRGSAIFMHLARLNYTPTEGCIAISLPDMLEVLPQLTVDTQVEVITD